MDPVVVKITEDELLAVISKIKDHLEAYERIETSAERALSEITDLVAPVDTTPVE